MFSLQAEPMQSKSKLFSTVEDSTNYTIKTHTHKKLHMLEQLFLHCTPTEFLQWEGEYWMLKQVWET
jgi:hypothetical protein